MKQHLSNLENKILTDIKSGRLKLRSRYIFLVEKFSLGSIFILSLILIVFFLNLVLFYIRATGNLEYLSFGIDGLSAFLESFPYLLVISLIIFILIIGYFIKKNNLVYKLPFKYTALILLFIIILGSSALAYTDIANSLEQHVYKSEENIPFLKSFFNCSHHANNRGVMGIIQEVKPDELYIKTPHGFLTINLSEYQIQQDFKVGQFIMAIGTRNKNFFIAKRVRIANQDNLPVINRHIRHRFYNLNKNSTTTSNGINFDSCSLNQPQHHGCY